MSALRQDDLSLSSHSNQGSESVPRSSRYFRMSLNRSPRTLRFPNLILHTGSRFTIAQSSLIHSTPGSNARRPSSQNAFYGASAIWFLLIHSNCSGVNPSRLRYLLLPTEFCATTSASSSQSIGGDVMAPLDKRCASGSVGVANMRIPNGGLLISRNLCAELVALLLRGFAGPDIVSSSITKA
jgi:hypothetical protein